MQLALFWLFSILMLLFGLGVVFFRNPVSSAMSLVMSFVALAAVFVTLDAFFIAVVQVMVYAGAVLVLFLFIIMLLDLRDESRRPVNLLAWAGGGLVVSAFLAALMKVIGSDPSFQITKPAITGLQSANVARMFGPHFNFANGVINDVAAIGVTLFHRFNLPFQIIGVLLLAATVGVVVLSKKELK